MSTNSISVPELQAQVAKAQKNLDECEASRKSAGDTGGFPRKMKNPCDSLRTELNNLQQELSQALKAVAAAGLPGGGAAEAANSAGRAIDGALATSQLKNTGAERPAVSTGGGAFSSSGGGGNSPSPGGAPAPQNNPVQNPSVKESVTDPSCNAYDPLPKLSSIPGLDQVTEPTIGAPHSGIIPRPDLMHSNPADDYGDDEHNPHGEYGDKPPTGVPFGGEGGRPPEDPFADTPDID